METTSVKEKIVRIFKKIEAGIIESPEKVEEIKGIYLFLIEGEGGGVFHLNLKDEPGVSYEKKPADCILRIRDKDFIKLVKGVLPGFKAILNGKLKVDGDLIMATRLNEIFRSIKDKN